MDAVTTTLSIIASGSTFAVNLYLALQVRKDRRQRRKGGRHRK